MAETSSPELIIYVDGDKADWQEFRPGSCRKVLYENILNRAGSQHQAYTPDGCLLLEVVPGRTR